MVNSNNILAIFLRGLLMGVSDIMPGISGGTIALITGIYDRLIGSISNIKLMFLIKWEDKKSVLPQYRRNSKWLRK